MFTRFRKSTIQRLRQEPKKKIKILFLCASPCDARTYFGKFIDILSRTPLQWIFTISRRSTANSNKSFSGPGPMGAYGFSLHIRAIASLMNCFCGPKTSFSPLRFSFPNNSHAVWLPNSDYSSAVYTGEPECTHRETPSFFGFAGVALVFIFLFF